MKSTISVGLWVAGLALGFATGGPAYSQASLNGPSTILNTDGSSCKTTSGSGCAENYQFASSTGTSNTTVTAGPTTYDVADTFNQTRSSITTLSDFGTTAYATNCPGGVNCLSNSVNGSPPLLTWNFQDNFDFTTPSGPTKVQGAVLSFAIPSFGVGLQDVQARIVTFVSDTQNNANATAMVGGTGPQMTVVDGWQTLTQTVSNSPPDTLYTAALTNKVLAAGTEYVLEVRGEALTTAAGYTGTVTFEPVPLPAGLPLLLSGLGAFGFLRRRRPASV